MTRRIQDGDDKRAKVTDKMLRDDLGIGLTVAQIGRKHGLTRQAVHYRVKKLTLTTVTVAVTAPMESRRFVASTLSVAERLQRSAERAGLMEDACERYMLDPDDPTRYDIGARASDIWVIYTEQVNGKPVTKRGRLSDLLERVESGLAITIDAGESKFADPRELILKTMATVQSIIKTQASIVRQLAEIKTMQVLRDTLLHEIMGADAEIGRRVADAVRRTLVLSGTVIDDTSALFTDSGAGSQQVPN